MKGNEVTAVNNYGLVERRIDSVKVIEVIEVSLTQYENEKDGFKGKVIEHWTKDGKLLGRFPVIE